MSLIYCKIIAISFLISSSLFSEPRVDPRNLHERVLAIVPMVGTGSYADPRRPAIAPSAVRAGRNEILSWSFEPSDDASHWWSWWRGTRQRSEPCWPTRAR